jgi:hypothetical protein
MRPLAVSTLCFETALLINVYCCQLGDSIHGFRTSIAIGRQSF